MGILVAPIVEQSHNTLPGDPDQCCSIVDGLDLLHLHQKFVGDANDW
jgi:hypothetical protein